MASEPNIFLFPFWELGRIPKVFIGTDCFLINVPQIVSSNSASDSLSIRLEPPAGRRHRCSGFLLRGWKSTPCVNLPQTKTSQGSGDQTAVNSLQDCPISDAFTEAVTRCHKCLSLHLCGLELGEAPALGSRGVFLRKRSQAHTSLPSPPDLPSPPPPLPPCSNEAAFKDQGSLMES